MNPSETRILPLPTSLSAKHAAIVSMPASAWYWLDDLVSRSYPIGGYKDLVKGFNDANSAEELSSALRHHAQQHCDRQMGELYNLSNDNISKAKISLKANPGNPDAPDLSRQMPSVYQLFRFMPHPTYLTTVWERRNYHLRPL